jgi:threonine/homoserine/homoserine lactone efflux protein
MMVVSLFLFGFFFSFAGSITPSMLNMTALKISLEKGQKETNKYALGVSLVVLLQAYIAVFLTRYISENPNILETLEKAGIFIFAALSVYFYRESKKNKNSIEAKTEKEQHAFLTGVLLSAFNMFSIPFFCGVIVALEAFTFFSFDTVPVLFFVVGSFLGTFLILFLYGKFAKRVQQLTGKLTNDINIILAILTGFIAVFTAIKTLL